MSFANDYIDVPARIAQFKADHPKGTLQTLHLRDVEIGGQWFIEAKAIALRDPEDTAPGIAYSREQFPGKTPYTKMSEAENAETSAWGRALAALGYATKLDGSPGIANGEAVRNRRAEQSTPIPAAKPPKTLTPSQAAKVEDALLSAGVDVKKIQLALTARGVGDIPELTVEQANDLVKELKA